jgi:hypothetical protein
LGGRCVARRLRPRREVVGSVRPGAREPRGGPEGAAFRQSTASQEAGRGRAGPAATECVGRRRPGPPRMFRHPREARTRRLDDVQHPVDARRRPARAEEVRRG